MTAGAARRIPPWWMLPPAALFALNFVLELTMRQPAQTNIVYRPGVMLGTVALDLLLIGYVLVAAAVSHVEVRSTLGMSRPRAGAVRLAVGLGIGVVAVNLLADRLAQASQKQGIAPTHDPASRAQWIALGVAVVALVVIAPVAEEMVFRGLGFATLGRHALLISSVLFALAHGMAVLLLPVFAAGLALGYARMRTGSIYTGVAMHMSLNAIALTVALLTG